MLKYIIYLWNEKWNKIRMLLNKIWNVDYGNKRGWIRYSSELFLDYL